MAKKQIVTETAVETLAVSATETVELPASPYRLMAGNEALFEETLNKAYDQVAYMWIKYHKMPNEDTNTKEEITDRWVLPMTRIYDGTKGRRYFRTECMHARMEKDAAHLLKEKRAFKMTTDRVFLVSRVEAFCVNVKPFTDKNKHYLELLTTYPQLRTRLGLKAVWIETTDEDGKPLHVQVLVAAQ